jgi:hypothetical protein
MQREPVVQFELKVVAQGGGVGGGGREKGGDFSGQEEGRQSVSWAVLSVPCELFVELEAEIVKHSPFAVTSVSTLANGYHGYVPSAVAFERKGGYETKELTSTKLAPEAASVVVGTAVSLLHEAHAALFASPALAGST